MNEEMEGKEHEAVRLETQNGYLKRGARLRDWLEMVCSAPPAKNDHTLGKIIIHNWF